MVIQVPLVTYESQVIDHNILCAKRNFVTRDLSALVQEPLESVSFIF